MGRKAGATPILLALIGTFFSATDACSPYFDAEATTTPRPATTEPPGTTTPPSRRWTHEQDADALHFVIIGDIGGSQDHPYTTPDQLMTADALATLTDSFHLDFIAELGDNFYHNGVTDVNDHRFQATFEEVYAAESLRHVPWYIVAGNHDWDGNVYAQIEYSQMSERWNYPSLYYSERFPIPSTEGAAVRLIMVDTQIMCGNIDHSRQGSPPVGPNNQLDAIVQLAWLEEQLAEAREEYVIVAGHYPVWSVGGHGPTGCLVDLLKPLLEAHNVTAYFGAHDHCLEHIHEENSPVEYFVSGGGHLMDPSDLYKTAVREEWQKFHFGDIHSRGGFAYISASAHNMTVTFTDSRNMHDLYEVTLTPRRN